VGLRKVSRNLKPEAEPPAPEPLDPLDGAAGARRSKAAANKPSTNTPSAKTCIASRQGMGPMAMATPTGTSKVPAPTPELAMPPAKPRRVVNQGCTLAIDGV
jgi:hypothetical protein